MSQSVIAPLETAARRVGLNQVIGRDSQPSDDRDGGAGGSPNARHLHPSGGDSGAARPDEYDATRAVGARLADQFTREGLGTHRLGIETPRLGSTGRATYGPPPRRDASLRVQRIMQLAVLASAMRVHGISEPSISRAQRYAARLFDVFEARGIRIPPPRVFDPMVPSARDRQRRRRTPERTANRERERVPSEPCVLSR
jgi:hypothetical protein